ncbi:MAG: hypothetical protein PHF79_01060 [Candidatus Pacebacteria bacterium]|nr:hypothetical protein [Candidatus Paceibacterota bacterium]
MSASQQRISTGDETLMEGAAWCVYALDFVINIVGDWFLVGEIISIIFMAVMTAVYIFWFTTKNVKITDPTIFKVFILRDIVALIPIIDLLPIFPQKEGLPQPGFPGMVRAVIQASREQDKIQNQKNAGAESKIIRPNRFRPEGASDEKPNRFRNQPANNQGDSDEYQEAA